MGDGFLGFLVLHCQPVLQPNQCFAYAISHQGDIKYINQKVDGISLTFFRVEGVEAMQKTISLMVIVGAFCGSALCVNAVAAPPVNNAVPPCDESVNSRKPSCNMDSDSVNQPPQMPHERGVIVPPEVPAEGLPNQEQRRQQQRPLPNDPVPVDPASQKPGNNLKN